MLDFIKTIPPELVWAMLGLAFIFMEFLIPGVVIAFFGVGALITALAAWMGVHSLSFQLMIFLVTSVSTLALLRKYVKKTFLGNAKGVNELPNFNVEIGKIVPVVEFIQPGEVGGKVRYQGSPWSARANEPIAPGESVKIVGCDNLTLLVEKVEKEG